MNTLKFNLIVFWHDIRRHKIDVKTTTLTYPNIHKVVYCNTCGFIIAEEIYEYGLENYY